MGSQLQYSGEAGYSQTRAEPGDDLKIRDINNISRNYRLGFNYMPIRQRDENLTFSAGLYARDVRSRIFGTVALTDDSIRAVHAGVNYQFSEDGGAVNLVAAIFTQGLDVLNSTQKGSLLASRAEASPDFSKLNFRFMRVQPLPYNVALIASMVAQWSPHPLFSSEEFGYGGQNYGRAYDTSELTGDSGAAAALEFRYNGLPATGHLQFVPYAFFDRGFVWNDDTGSEQSATAGSAGLGLSFFVGQTLNGDVNMAFPILREVGAPINNRSQGPRLNFSVSAVF